ncbi:hypothetical protein QFC21_002518 [Naganishia friedmannii]|uniref:Uncharacterized protein n=1 Tax=Naganishia friedmannii TaxID=89922 RepID=A0ACC2VWD5_9TREE|nr:hypothetical protein QFC21_002518 [Naganishia friedmannii]
MPKPVTSWGRKLPTAGTLALGILVGLIFATFFRSSPQTGPTWTGGHSNGLRASAIGGGSRLSRMVELPTVTQRFRILEIIGSLSAHHTKECTRTPQKPYVEQVHHRYEPLFGFKPHNHRGWFGKGGYSDNVPDTRSQQIKRDLSASNHKYFIAINLYNSFDVIPDLFATLFRVSAVLGYQNVYVSIYENGSSDQTKALLKIFDALARTVGMRIIIRTSMRTRGQFNHRIEYLAEVRNAAMVPLRELRDTEGELFDSIIFMNDILPCVDDVLELIWQSRRQNAGITCAADYMFHDDIGAPVFYDNWVARDINGTALENAPFEQVFHHPESEKRFMTHLPVQVQSCWNGIAVLDPAPFYAPNPVKFRMARLAENECSASECGLICMYDVIHPERRNLTSIRGYKRLGGMPDDPTSDPQDRTWYGPHDRLFVAEESEVLKFVPGPEYVWCWGWDGAGDLDGPDVDPIWEQLNLNDPTMIEIKHDRSMHGWP